jgi:hypothetical protein
VGAGYMLNLASEASCCRILWLARCQVGIYVGCRGRLTYPKILPAGGGKGRGPSLSQFGPLKEPTGKLFQVLISHAGAQKRGFVDFLAAEFCQSYPALTLFLDEYSLIPGEDALRIFHAALGDADVGACMPGPEGGHCVLFWTLLCQPCNMYDAVWGHMPWWSWQDSI